MAVWTSIRGHAERALQSVTLVTLCQAFLIHRRELSVWAQIHKNNLKKHTLYPLYKRNNVRFPHQYVFGEVPVFRRATECLRCVSDYMKKKKKDVRRYFLRNFQDIFSDIWLNLEFHSVFFHVLYTTVAWFALVSLQRTKNNSNNIKTSVKIMLVMLACNLQPHRKYILTAGQMCIE